MYFSRMNQYTVNELQSLAIINIATFLMAHRVYFRVDPAITIVLGLIRTVRVGRMKLGTFRILFIMPKSDDCSLVTMTLVGTNNLS